MMQICKHGHGFCFCIIASGCVRFKFWIVTFRFRRFRAVSDVALLDYSYHFVYIEFINFEHVEGARPQQNAHRTTF